MNTYYAWMIMVVNNANALCIIKLLDLFMVCDLISNSLNSPQSTLDLYQVLAECYV